MKDKYVIIKQLGQLTLVLFVYAIARYLNVHFYNHISLKPNMTQTIFMMNVVS